MWEIIAVIAPPSTKKSKRSLNSKVNLSFRDELILRLLRT